jgi:hypothetical protein
MTTDPNLLAALFCLIGGPVLCIIAILVANFFGE